MMSVITVIRLEVDFPMSARLLLLIIMLVITTGCASKLLKPYIKNYADYDESVYVIDHGIHTALVVESSDIVEKIGLQGTFYSSFRFIEIGRGDADFYQDEEENFSTALKALFLSTPAVLYLRAYNSLPDKHDSSSHTIGIRFSSE
ncbi:MAG: DUF2459 domain-containing protein, partial [Gammaproteobacteria bacterium]|nr:DUF2459 domain-containing protein [Gammaproteobacteria bacterium]